MTGPAATVSFRKRKSEGGRRREGGRERREKVRGESDGDVFVDTWLTGLFPGHL